MTDPRPVHLPEIDRLKGLAILAVVCIHAKLGEGSVFFEFVINRAVPIFLFLFGVTSEFWWERRLGRGTGGAVRDWLSGRFTRLYVPWWGMVALWWAWVLVTGQSPATLAWTDALLNFAGYAPWIGTAWFVTVILEIVLVFPLLRLAATRLPPWLSLSIAAGLTAFCGWHTYDIVDAGRLYLGDHVPPPGWVYIWIFAPRDFFPVVAGIVVATRLRGRPGKALSAAGLLCVAASYFLMQALHRLPDDAFVGPLREQVVFFLVDVPLAVGLLGAVTHVPLPRPVARPLEWFGRASWGLYLGHLLVHEVLHLAGVAPEGGPAEIRLVYGLILLATGLVIVGLGTLVRRGALAVWRRLPRA